VKGGQHQQVAWNDLRSFDVIVPTLRRSLALRPDGTAASKPILLDVEVFDATFE